MTYFTSDHHFWHENIIRYCQRPFATVEEMNERMIKAWNAVAGQGDVVYYLGDFAMAFRPVEAYLQRLLGEKHLILGNHDFAHPGHKRSRKPGEQAAWAQKYLDNGFASVATEIERLELSGLGQVNLSHFPYFEESSGQDARGAEYRLKDNGVTLLCGHVHEKWRLRRTKLGTLMVNVGVDAWDFKPVSVPEIASLLASPEAAALKPGLQLGGPLAPRPQSRASVQSARR
jgi:calcineurin-like phosphoesterase family protein